MIALSVVGNNEINLVKVNLLLQILDKIETVRCPDGIDEHGFFFLNQVGILAGTVHDRVIVTVKALQFPIDIADPAHISFYMLPHIVLLMLPQLLQPGIRPWLPQHCPELLPVLLLQ